MTSEYGPQLPVSERTHATKYRLEGESFRECTARVANTLADSVEHYNAFRDVLLDMRFLPGGRVQNAIGSPRQTTAFNCFVSRTIEDSMSGIMQAATDASETMRLGGGIGYDFSTLRPSGANIISLASKSSGPLSFMTVFDALCATVSSAGERRGAQMGVMMVWHPDIEAFIEAKANDTEYTQFNLSVGITDEFMEAVVNRTDFDLMFDRVVYKRVFAPYLWEKIMRATWDWAEPGVLFIDRINEFNNLYYCEDIAATNPCGEQPLPPYGACLLGSFNLTRYIFDTGEGYEFDWGEFKKDIPSVVRALDNVIDNTTFPLSEQEGEARSKRRMGLGVTGEANALEALGYVYGGDDYLTFMESIHKELAVSSYMASIQLAKEKGTFPLFDKEKYLESKFIKGLPRKVRNAIAEHGIRNSHLLSIAPTGTISLCADNVSSGIEPPYLLEVERTIITEDGPTLERMDDYGYKEFGVAGVTADEATVDDHLNVLAVATRWSDSAVSKTVNVGDDVTYEEFQEIYLKAWKMGCKGCTTFRKAGKRYGILNEVKEEKEPSACYIDSESGRKTCE